MGKFNETNSSYRGSSYRGSSYRGSNYRGSNYRGASNGPPRGGRLSHARGGYVGRIEGRGERPDPRTDARYHLKSQAAQRNNSEHIIDARSILRNNSYRDNQSSPRRDFNESSRGRNNLRNDNGRESYRRGIGPRRGSGGARGHKDDRSNSRGRFNSERRCNRDDYNAGDRNGTGSGGGEGKEIRVTVPGLNKSRGDSYSQDRSSSSRQINSSSRDHYVTKLEKNTTITVNNSKYCMGSSSSETSSAPKRKARSRSYSPDFRPSKDRTGKEKSNSMKFEPIKIQILNSNYVPPSVNNPNKSEDSMDYESSSSEYDTNNKYQAAKKNSIPNSQQTPQSQTLASAQQQPQQSPTSSSVLGLTPVAAALFQNSSLSSLNAFHSSYKQPGLVNVENFPAVASGVYSNGYDRLWNTNPNHQTHSFYTSNKAPAPSVAEIPKEPAQPTGKSSKEGFKLLVSNLHPKVSEDDVLELFSDIGPIKRARFIDKGLAEVIYVRIEHAKEAIHKYDLKELDGRQMVIGFADKSHLTSLTEQHAAYNSQIPPPVLTNSSTYSGGAVSTSSLPYTNHSKTIDNSVASYYEASHKLRQEPVASTLSERFKTKSQSSVRIPESKHIDKSQSINHVDSSIIHQVLFKKAPSTNGAPVTFTVKL